MRTIGFLGWGQAGARSQVVPLAALIALSFATAASAEPAGSASVRFTRLTPVKVRATLFLPSESVRLTLRAGAVKRVRVVRTSASGTFTVDFGSLRENDRCGVAMTLVAVGSGGDRATYRLPPRECATATTAIRAD